MCSWANRARSNPGSFEMSLIFVILWITPSLKGGEAQGDEARAYGWRLQRCIFIYGNVYFITHTGKGVSTEEYRGPGLINVRGVYFPLEGSVAISSRSCCAFVACRVLTCSLPYSAFSVPHGKGIRPPQLLTCTVPAAGVT